MARKWKPRHIVIVTITCAAVFLLTLTAGLLQAAESQTPSDAREKLLGMVTGDISRSLAVASIASVVSSDPLPSSTVSSGFPESAIYGMGQSSNGQLGVGISSDTNIPVLLSPNVFGGPIAPGLNHTLVTDNEGNLWAAGDDVSGQFGDGSTLSSTMTISQTSVTDIRSVAAGSLHSLIVTTDGTVMGTGEGSMGQLGNGGIDTDTFSAIDIAGAVKVRSNSNNSFVVTDVGELFVFGENINGELGTGIPGSPSLTPAKVLASGVIDVASSYMHTLVLMADGAVMAMGLNTYGQFGDGTTDSSMSPKVVIESGVKAIEAGNSFSLFLMADGSLQGAGANWDGQLGVGDTTTYSTRITIEAGDVANIAAGSSHSMYVTADGTLKGMGSNLSGQLGLGDFNPRLEADTITSGVVDVAANYNNTFFIKRDLISLEIKGITRVYQGTTANFDCYAHWSDGKISRVTEKVFWSENSENSSIELNSGILDLTNATIPEYITITASYLGITDTRDITVTKPSMGSSLHGCGDNAYSQLGLDTVVDMPVVMDISDDNVISAAGGNGHSLYVREDGSVFSMGDNTYGQLGTGDTIPKTSPFLINMTKPAIAVGAGNYHSFIVFRDGSLYTMGRNDEGQLGDGSQFNRSSPTKIKHTGVIQADGGSGHSIFLTTGGEVWTMGRNLEGQLGDGTTLGSDLPILAHTGGAVAVAAGANHTIFRTDDSGMWGMGDNSRGQLGLGPAPSQQLIPTVIVTSGVADMAAGAYHTLYSSLENRIYVTGDNSFGQLGTGSTGTGMSTFTNLAGYSGVVRVYAGANFSFFRTVDSIFGMGSNMDGQFANGTFTSTSTPVLLYFSGTLNPPLVVPGARHVLLTRGWLGDIDGNWQITPSDTIILLKILTNSYQGTIGPYSDINADSQIGFPEVIYTLRKAAGL